MRRRGGLAGVTASPTMVGALTVMVVILAVFLAYNANTGLPFVPSYRISAILPDAAQLVPGNEVRVGGVRVGQIEDVGPGVRRRRQLQRPPRPEARTPTSTRCPRTRPLIVRARSALGLKYLEIDRGTSDEGYPEGSVIPQSAAHPQPVEIDEVLSTFDAPTRAAIQENLFEFGNALAGRGPDLNAALAELPDTVTLPDAGDEEPGLAEHPAGAVHQRQRRRRGRGRPGRRDPGRPVRQPRHHVHRARRGRAPVHPGHDLRDAADLRPGGAELPGDPPVPGPQRAALPRPAAGRARDREDRADDRRHARDRHPGGRRLAAAQPRAAADRGGAARPSTTTRTCATGSAA